MNWAKIGLDALKGALVAAAVDFGGDGFAGEDGNGSGSFGEAVGLGRLGGVEGEVVADALEVVFLVEGVGEPGKSDGDHLVDALGG